MALYLFLEELYIKLRGILCLLVKRFAHCQAKPCCLYQSLHSLLLYIILPLKVPIISETIVLLKAGRRHKNGQKTDLDLLNLSLLEWELLRKAENISTFCKVINAMWYRTNTQQIN